MSIKIAKTPVTTLKAMWKVLFSLGLVLLASACSTLLPESHSNTTPFKSFDEARIAVEALVPMKTDKTALEKDGFSLKNFPNAAILTHSDVARRFLPSSLLRREDLDPGIIACLEARDGCRGLEITGAKIDKARTGSFWADFLNFQRLTNTTGWRFNALVLLVNDVVVYRSWGGQPDVNESEQTHNPLGPLQDIGPSTAAGAATR
jgi:hypothetical protein